MKHTQIRFTLGLLVVALHPALLSAEAMRLRETREAVGKHISAIRVIQQQILTGVEEFLELNTKDALAVKRADVSARKLCIEELARVKRAPTGGIFGFDDDGKRKERVKAKKERVAVLEKMVTTDDLPGMMREATAVLKREKTSYVRKGYDLLISSNNRKFSEGESLELKALIAKYADLKAMLAAIQLEAPAKTDAQE